MRPRTLKGALLGVCLALVACGDDVDGGSLYDVLDESVPEPVVEAVRADYPETSINDIEATYEQLRREAPDADDDQYVAWMLEALKWEHAVDEWNDCLQRHGGANEGCHADEFGPDPEEVFDRDNPLGP